VHRHGGGHSYKCPACGKPRTLAATYQTFNRMKVEFLDDITDNGRYPDADPDMLIRLYSFDQIEASKLRAAIQFQLVERNDVLDLSTLDFIQTENCTLRFEISKQKKGIEPSFDRNFVCQMSIEDYENMISIIEPFANDENEMSGYSWLYDPAKGKINLLFSPGGTW